MRDFESMGMTSIKGQGNYLCVAVGNGGKLKEFGNIGDRCDQGPCHVGVQCSLRQDGGCSYYDAQGLASESEIVVTNYAYWLTLGRHTDPDAIGKFDLMVCDEVHGAPDRLAEFCTVSLDRSEVKSLLSLDLPRVGDGIDGCAEWAKGAVITAKNRYAEVRDRLANGARKDRKELTKTLLRIGSMSRDLVELSKAGAWKSGESPKVDARIPGVSNDWVVEDAHRGLKFSPVWAHAYAEEYLFRGVKRVVLASATLSRGVGKYLGIASKDTEYWEAGEGFDPRRRPFIYVPSVRVDKRITEGEVRIWINKIDQIIDGRLDRKGIIHTRSYERAKTILARSRHRSVMLSNLGANTEEVVSRFKRAKAPCILVSPSLEEGYDFEGELCRWQIIAKVPFVDSRDPVMKARMKSDKEYGNYLTAQSLVQMAGRGMRSKEDYCETFITDLHWAWFRKAVQWPKWFRKAWVYSREVPGAIKL